MEAHFAVAHIAFNLCLGRQSRNGVNDNEVNGARTNQVVGNFQRLLTVVRLGNNQVLRIYTQFLCVETVKRVLCINEGCDTACFLRFRDGVEGEGSLTRRFWSIDFNHTTAGIATDTEGHIQAQRARRNHFHFFYCVVAHAHDSPFSIGFV